MRLGDEESKLESALPTPLQHVFECSSPVLGKRGARVREIRADLPRTVTDPIEKMFGSISFRDYTSRARIILAERPHESNLDYLELLVRILYELMRVYWKAPIPFQIMFVSQRLTEYQLANIRPGMGVFVVDLDSLRERSSDESTFARFLRTISDRLHESFTQWIGYLVLYGNSDSLAHIKKLWEPRVISRRVVYTSLSPYIEIRNNVSRQQVLGIISLLYGGVNGLEEADTVNQAVLRAEDAYLTGLETVANDPFISIYARPAIDEEEAKQDSAFIHFALKMAALRYLMETGVDLSAVTVESVVANIPIDIRVERGWGNSIAIEIETLHGAGNPVSRLSMVIRERLSLGYNVWVVIPPTYALIFAPQIRGLMRHFAERVEFYTFDTTRYTLRSLSEYYAVLDKILAEQ